uniref:Uncharacterized protein n=1 Tax=Anopheles darlingi TaxID=43151 RepID=A0A2M4DHV7_ANODA
MDPTTVRMVPMAQTVRMVPMALTVRMVQTALTVRMDQMALTVRMDQMALRVPTAPMKQMKTKNRRPLAHHRRRYHRARQRAPHRTRQFRQEVTVCANRKASWNIQRIVRSFTDASTMAMADMIVTSLLAVRALFGTMIFSPVIILRLFKILSVVQEPIKRPQRQPRAVRLGPETLICHRRNLQPSPCLLLRNKR